MDTRRDEKRIYIFNSSGNIQFKIKTVHHYPVYFYFFSTFSLAVSARVWWALKWKLWHVVVQKFILDFGQLMSQRCKFLLTTLSLFEWENTKYILYCKLIYKITEVFFLTRHKNTDMCSIVYRR